MEYGLFCIVFVKENYQGYNIYIFPTQILLHYISSYFLLFHTIKKYKKRRQNNENMDGE